MILYHGSTELVDHPEIRASENYLDFGTGFYTTTSYEQAERWAKTKMRRENKSVGYITIYEFDFDGAKSECTICLFEKAEMSWLLFVTRNRSGESVNSGTDMHIGPVADDKVYRSIRLFETGVLDAEETIKHLKTEKLQDQWTFHTDKILSYVKYLDHKVIRQEEVK